MGGENWRGGGPERIGRRGKGWKMAGSRNSQKAGIIYSALKKNFQKQEPKMFFDLHLAYFETSGPTKKQKSAVGLKS